jgi:hypothetical protein
VQTAIVDERSELRRTAAVGGVSTSRRVRNDDIVLVGRDCVVDAPLTPGARLEPGATA